MLISVQDGLSHRAQSGYGALARHLILGLADRGHEVVVQGGSKAWMEVEPGARERLEDLRVEAAVPPAADVVLQTAIPPNCRRFTAPSVFYTQNALGGLRRDWLEPLGRADHLVVPGEFDRRVFARHFSSVSVSPQGSNPQVFKPVPRHGYAEGVINKVKVVKRRAYGIPTFTAFRDRTLLACGVAL